MQICKELSEVQNGIIFGFREKVGSISETAKFVDCSCVTVVKVIEVTDGCRGEFGRIDVLPLSNIPPDEPRGYQQCLQTTVQRSLLRLVLRSRRLVHAPMLTAVHQQRRLEFSYRYRNCASMRGDR
ncbi:hypothetical protein TNCV_2950241 [Trichonephila clavipes]|nr:hypothetical protein TNCV_2950241 [Trichonephila clavipes]